MKALKLSLVFWGVIAMMTSCGTAQKQDAKVVDFEHHFLTQEFLDYLATRTTPPMYDPSTGILTSREGFDQMIDIPFLNTGKTLKELWTDPGQGRIDDMDDAGVDIVMLSSCIYILDEENAVHWAAATNDAAEKMIKDFPGRFIGSMTLPMPYVDASLKEMQRCIDMGFRIWTVASNFGEGTPRLYDPVYEPLLAMAEKNNIVLFLHPDTPTEPTLLDNGSTYATAGLGYGQDAMKTLFRLVTSGVFDRHPHLRLVMGHYGEYLPFIMNRASHMLTHVPDPHFKNRHDFAYYFSHHNIMIGTSGSCDENVFRCAAQTVGTSNIIYASDYPFEMYRHTVDAINNFELTDEERSSIFGSNCWNYIAAKEPLWDVTPVPQQKLVQKTPSVKGYDFGHHYYIKPFYDAITDRTEAPRIDAKANTFYLHDSLFFSMSMEHLDIGNMLVDISEKRIADMDAASVDVAVMSSSEGMAELPERQAVELCRQANDTVMELQKRYPGRIMGEMVLPVPYVEASLVEMRRCAAAGFKVWCVASNYQIAPGKATYIYEEKYEPLLAEAEKLGIRIYLHPQLPIDDDFQDNGYSYAAGALGFCTDAMRTTVRLVLNGTFDRHPDLRVITAHLGEYFPYVLERLDNRFGYQPDPFVKNRKSFKEYFDNHNLMASTSGIMSASAFNCLKNSIGIDNIVFASDYPYESYQQQADFVRGLDLTQEELDKVWGLNAEKYILK